MEGVSLNQLVGHKIKLPISGKTYELSPLNIYDFAELQDWAESYPVNSVKKHINVNGNLTEDEKKLLDQAKKIQTLLIRVRGKFPCSEEEENKAAEYIYNYITSVDGMIKMLLLCLRKSNPDVNMDDVKLIMDEVELSRLQSIIDRLSFPESDPLDILAVDDKIEDSSQKKTFLGWFIQLIGARCFKLLSKWGYHHEISPA